MKLPMGTGAKFDDKQSITFNLTQSSPSQVHKVHKVNGNWS